MSVVFADDWLTVHHGDARAVLPTLASESIDAVVTSPPYWRQRSYLADDDPLKPLELGSEPTFDEWVANLVELAREIRRVLVPAGSLWLVLGDRYVAHGGGYTQPGHIGIRQSPRDGRAFARHVPRRSTLRGYPEGVRRKSLLLAPFRFAIAMCEDGWILRDKVVWAKTNGLPESVQDRLHVRDEVVLRFTAIRASRTHAEAAQALGVTKHTVEQFVSDMRRRGELPDDIAAQLRARAGHNAGAGRRPATVEAQGGEEGAPATAAATAEPPEPEPAAEVATPPSPPDRPHREAVTVQAEEQPTVVHLTITIDVVRLAEAMRTWAAYQLAPFFEGLAKVVHEAQS